MTRCHIRNKGIVRCCHLGIKRILENTKSSTMNDSGMGNSYARLVWVSDEIFIYYSHLDACYQFDNNRKAELAIWHQTRFKLFTIGYDDVS